MPAVCRNPKCSRGFQQGQWMKVTGSPFPGQTRWECPECGYSCIRNTQHGDFPKSRQKAKGSFPAATCLIELGILVSLATGAYFLFFR
jgi:hypothetical protein